MGRFVRARWRAECPQRPPDLIYTTTDGYRCWRWNAEGVEMLEHRWIVDPGPGRIVHHADHDRKDNDRSNLHALSRTEHGVAHRHVPDVTLVALHAAGLTTVAVGAAVGMHSSAVSRRLRRAGVDSGRPAWNRVEVDSAEVLRRHDAGQRATAIAAAVGVSVNVVRRVLRQNGRRGTPGRPPKESHRMPRVDLDAEDRTRHRRDRVATAADDGWALDCSAAGGPAISAALSQAAGTLDVAS